MAGAQACDQCGAAIQPAQISRGQAGRWAGKLLCPTCYQQKRSSVEDVGEAAPTGPPKISGAIPVATPPHTESISLVEPEQGRGSAPVIQSLGATPSSLTPERTESYTRKPAVTGRGACRVRTFHSKLQVESIQFMDGTINQWLDENPDIEVKFVTSTIGTMAGKHP